MLAHEGCRERIGGCRMPHGVCGRWCESLIERVAGWT
jgi:hypothetical protein